MTNPMRQLSIGFGSMQIINKVQYFDGSNGYIIKIIYFFLNHREQLLFSILSNGEE